MIEKKKWLLVTFYTTAAAMQMEKNCKKNGYSGRLVPVPRNITSDCGIAWRAEISDRPLMEKIAENLETEGMYEVEL